MKMKELTLKQIRTLAALNKLDIERHGSSYHVITNLPNGNVNSTWFDSLKELSQLFNHLNIAWRFVKTEWVKEHRESCLSRIMDS